MRLREHPGIGEGRTDILPCDPRTLRVIPNYNVRDLSTPEARAELDELKAQVREHGVKTPLVVRFDGENIWIVEGHRRHTVAMELIREYEASNGTEGSDIKFVPIKAEAPGTTDIDRDFGLETSNSGSRLKPLELANLIYRLNNTRGLPLEQIAKGLGRGLDSIRKTLALRGTLPEEVKEQVRAGDISAHEAAKLVKGLARGVDPVEAAKMIAANKEENKRLGVGKKKNHKVTAKTLKRDKPKVEGKGNDAADQKVQLASTPGHSLPADAKHRVAPDAVHPNRLGSDVSSVEQPRPMSAVLTDIDNLVKLPPPSAVSLATGETINIRPIVEVIPTQPSLKHLVSQEITKLLGELAVVAEDNQLGERDPEELIGVRVSLLARADRLYRQIIGEVAA